MNKYTKKKCCILNLLLVESYFSESSNFFSKEYGLNAFKPAFPEIHLLKNPFCFLTNLFIFLSKNYNFI